MSSVVEICNLALSQIRSFSINSLDDTTIQAQQCNLNYPYARDKVLGDFDWGFNNSTKALQLLESKVFGWAYAWQYPNDCLHINMLIRSDEDVEPDSSGSRFYDRRWSILGAQNRVDYSIALNDGAKVIVSNEDDLYIKYRAKVTDVTLYPPEVRRMIAYELASNIAISLAGVKDGRILRADALALYNAAKDQMQADAANQQQVPQTDSEFITVRS